MRYFTFYSKNIFFTVISLHVIRYYPTLVIRLLPAFVCLSQQLMQLGSPNLTQKRSSMSLEKVEIHLFWGQKVKGESHESQKQCCHGSLYSCE